MQEGNFDLSLPICYHIVMPKQSEAYTAAQVIRRPDGRDPASIYMTVPQVAAMRMCTRQTVKAAIYCGRLPAWHIGGIYLIPRADAEQWALRKAEVITATGRRKVYREHKLNMLRDAAAVRALESGNVLRRLDAPPEVPGRCL